MISDVNSDCKSKTFKTTVRIGALVAWLGVGYLISSVLNDFTKMTEQPYPNHPVALVFSMFAISTVIVALLWFGKPLNQMVRIPSAVALKAKLVEATTDDVSMEELQGESFQ